MLKGVINVLKPPGMTSHDVVYYIRRLYNIKRVGHAGTLDPAAAGVLPVFLGQATRLVEYMSDCQKSYRAEITFGFATDTGDSTGNVIKKEQCQMPTEDRINDVLKSFIGKIQQIPPMYSAIKMNGKKLYELARAGIDVERKPRNVEIDNIELLELRKQAIVIDVTCSKGTYIRSLCTDIGEKLHCPTVLSFLIRTKVGDFSLGNSWTLAEIEQHKEKVVQPADQALSHMPAVNLSTEQAIAFQHGQSITVSGPAQVCVRIYDADHHFIGIGRQSFSSALLMPVKVMSIIQ